MDLLLANYTLNNGVNIPSLGYGTWQTPEGDVAAVALERALQLGYRHIDTAAAYNNEKSVGEAIRKSGIAREELFVTSKLWNTERGYDKALKAFDKSLNDLALDYLDLYLIHWPANKKQFQNWNEINTETWRALEKLYKEGRVRAIGVSNYKPHHLEAFMGEVEVMPMVNQIEYHPGWMQHETVAFCEQHNILVEAWSPLGCGRLLENATLHEIAKTYHRTVAQICLRWCLQNGILPLSKSVTPSRIEENSKIFDFEIAASDMERINSLEACGFSGFDSDLADF